MINLIKNCTPKISEKDIYIYIQKGFCALYVHHRAPSMWSAAPASWDVSVAHGGMYIKQHMYLKHHISEWKVVGSMLKISHFYGLWDGVFTAFGCNLSRDAFHNFFVVHNIALSAAGHARWLFWCMFPQNLIVKGECIYIYKILYEIYCTQNLITMLKIWFCYT